MRLIWTAALRERLQRRICEPVNLLSRDPLRQGCARSDTDGAGTTGGRVFPLNLSGSFRAKPKLRRQTLNDPAAWRFVLAQQRVGLRLQARASFKGSQ
jgi:hypothetical protein